jgi:FkbM family methyltransferase
VGDLSAVVLRVPGLPDPLRIYTHDARDRVVSRSIRETGLWEPFESRLVLALLPPGGVFVDVGANIGYFSLLAASVVGAAGRVFAFEPDPANYSLLQNSAELNALAPRIHAVRAGLARHDGDARLYLSEDNLGDHQVYPGVTRRASVPIKLLDGGRYLSTRLDRLDLVKVDVQGAEYEVMAGLLPLLRAQRMPPQILIELTPWSLRQAGSSGRELIELLGALRQPFWIVDHVEHALVASGAEELARWCDQVDAVAGDRGFMNILVGAGL